MQLIRVVCAYSLLFLVGVVLSGSQERIVDGEVVTKPPSWIVQLYKDDVPECTGSLIYPQWVLSAGHCGNFENQSLRMGGSTAENGVLFNVEGSFILSGVGGNNDLALHKLTQPAKVQSVNLNRDPSLLKLIIKPKVRAMGYGVQSVAGENDLRLRQTSWQPIYSTSGINSAFEFGSNQDASTICTGDSGGPVLAENAVHLLVGVVSYSVEVDGLRCNGKAGAADIAANLDWIDLIVWSNGGPGEEVVPTPTQGAIPPAVVLPTSTRPLATSTPFVQDQTYIFLPLITR